MDELELVRLHEDGEHLVLGGTGGAQFTLPITEALRAAVRRDRPHLEHLRAEGERNLAPREIQSRLRSGESVESVADAAGLAVENVRRFAGPVVAEQEYVVDRVRASRQGHDDDSPTVGELVAQRLTARDVDPAGVAWSASREPGAQWVVTAAFEVGSGRRSARWTYDPSSRALHALDDEARWLSGTDAPQDPTPGSVAVFDVDATARASRGRTRPPADDGTAELLDDLSQRRGVRPRRSTPDLTDVSGQEPFEGFGPQIGTESPEPSDDPAPPVATVVHLPRIRARDLGAAGAAPEAEDGRADEDARETGDAPGTSADGDGAPGASAGSGAPTDRGDTRDTNGGGSDRHGGDGDRDRGSTSGTTAGGARPSGAREPRKGKNRTRAKVPSWDEIVFGARPE